MLAKAQWAHRLVLHASLHELHLWTTLLTCYWPLGIQNLTRTAVNVSQNLPCNVLQWASCMTSSVKWWLGGSSSRMLYMFTFFREMQTASHSYQSIVIQKWTRLVYSGFVLGNLWNLGMCTQESLRIFLPKLGNLVRESLLLDSLDPIDLCFLKFLSSKH